MLNHRSLKLILGFGCHCRNSAEKGCLLSRFHFTAVATFWVMSLVGIYPGKASSINYTHCARPCCIYKLDLKGYSCLDTFKKIRLRVLQTYFLARPFSLLFLLSRSCNNVQTFFLLKPKRTPNGCTRINP